MLKTTQLYGYHKEHSTLTEFAGYEMPLWYTTTMEEHLAVRNGSGIFDVSHMGRLDFTGPTATEFLEGLVPTSVGTQPAGKAFYTLLLNETGGIIDDLIIMRLSDDHYVMVVNAANAQTDLDHIRRLAPSDGTRLDVLTPSTAMIAVQGPGAQASLQPLTELDLSQLKRFRCAETKVLGERALISRTGYTGEDGFEVVVYDSTIERPDKAVRVWERLATTSVPCGLGARDSLRLEAGFPLHGLDIDQGTDPFQADLSWVLSAGKSAYFGSKAVAEAAKQPPSSVRRGVVLDQGIPRHGFDVESGSKNVGTVTSGTFSPLLRKGVAQCRLDSTASEYGTGVAVLVRGTPMAGKVVKPPFYDEQVYGWKRRSNGN